MIASSASRCRISISSCNAIAKVCSSHFPVLPCFRVRMSWISPLLLSHLFVVNFTGGLPNPERSLTGAMTDFRNFCSVCSLNHCWKACPFLCLEIHLLPKISGCFKKLSSLSALFKTFSKALSACLPKISYNICSLWCLLIPRSSSFRSILDSCGFDKEDELRVRSFRQKLAFSSSVPNARTSCKDGSSDFSTPQNDEYVSFVFLC